MPKTPTFSKSKITLELVTDLITEQFPQWSHLAIKIVEADSWDNKTFRLGDNMLIRLPSAKEYATQVEKEQHWLPLLSPSLPLQIPQPIAMGKPSKLYPWHWSVYLWLEGESANQVIVNDLSTLAIDLANFLNALYKIDVTDGPIAGAHNFYRGAHPRVYDHQTKDAISELQHDIDAAKATAVWEKALSSKWNRNPVWVHGDIASGNLLIKNNRLIAVIDFGCMGIGDPACDLMIAWTFFDNESRKIFKASLHLDSDTWDRARGWALWKTLQKSGPEAMQRNRILNEIFSEFDLNS